MGHRNQYDTVLLVSAALCAAVGSSRSAWAEQPRWAATAAPMAVAADAAEPASSALGGKKDEPTDRENRAGGCRIDFGVTPDDFGDPHDCSDTITTQYVGGHDIVFGTAVDVPGLAPVVVASDTACEPACRSGASGPLHPRLRVER